jgi:hypothetical protein
VITIRPDPASVASLLRQLTPERRAELQARTDGDLRANLEADILSSTLAYAGVDEATEATVTLGGVVPTDRPDIGYVWQLITPRVADHKRDYILQGRTMIQRFHCIYPHLVVAIGPQEMLARRHARRLGWHQVGIVPHRGTEAEIWRRSQT